MIILQNAREHKPKIDTTHSYFCLFLWLIHIYRRNRFCKAQYRTKIFQRACVCIITYKSDVKLWGFFAD